MVALVAPDALQLEDVVIVAEFRAALRKFLRRSELVADSCGLTPQRYLLLLLIKGAPDRSGRATVTDLAGRLQLAQSTVTELVARSVDAGLIAREPSTSDARVTYLRLTPEGERRLACSFTGLSAERNALYEAIGGLRPKAQS
jgi:DNA-binding MarR family transcriptional regulator